LRPCPVLNCGVVEQLPSPPHVDASIRRRPVHDRFDPKVVRMKLDSSGVLMTTSVRPRCVHAACAAALSIEDVVAS